MPNPFQQLAQPIAVQVANDPRHAVPVTSASEAIADHWAFQTMVANGPNKPNAFLQLSSDRPILIEQACGTASPGTLTITWVGSPSEYVPNARAPFTMVDHTGPVPEGFLGGSVAITVGPDGKIPLTRFALPCDSVNLAGKSRREFRIELAPATPGSCNFQITLSGRFLG